MAAILAITVLQNVRLFGKIQWIGRFIKKYENYDKH